MSKFRVAYVINDAAFFVSHRLHLALSVLDEGGNVIVITGRNVNKKIENKDDLEPLSLYAIFAFNSSKNGPCPSNADLDNLLKALCDTLQDYGAIVDDKQIVSITARKEYTKEPSHIAFKLEKLNSIYY